MLKKAICHFRLVMRHKTMVFRLCKKAGIPVRGFFHDMSKFSPTEFFESVKYYTGKKSPIIYCRQEQGYSKAWLHHKGRNKHHFEYWYDAELEHGMPIIPYKYTVEMICDNLAAGMTYKGKDWTQDYQLNYWTKKRKGKIIINPVIDAILTEVFTKVAEHGIDAVIRKDVLREIYERHVSEAKNREYYDKHMNRT